MKKFLPSRNFLSGRGGVQANVPCTVIVKFVDVHTYVLGIIPGALWEFTRLILRTVSWRKFHYHLHIISEVTKANRDVKNFFQGNTAGL